jgi:hypothetical protein
MLRWTTRPSWHPSPFPPGLTESEMEAIE